MTAKTKRINFSAIPKDHNKVKIILARKGMSFSYWVQCKERELIEEK